MAQNKLRYGLKSVYFAIATLATDGSATYATPVAFPGAVSLSLDPSGDNVRFNADNIAYWTANGNTGYTGTLEMARITDEFKKQVLKGVLDTKGVIIEDLNAPLVHFALLFQFEGDVKATRHVLYNCTCTRPNVAGQTKGEQIEPATESVNLTATSVYNSGLAKDIVKGETTDGTDNTTYNGWFGTVYVPTAAATT